MKKISPPNFGGVDSWVKLTREGRKPRSNFYQEPEDAPIFQPSSADWEDIECAYGNELPDALRSEIENIVDDYLWFFDCSKHKPYADEAIAYIEKIAGSSFPPKSLAKLPHNAAQKAARDVFLENYLFDETSTSDETSAANFVTTPDEIRLAARDFVNDLKNIDVTSSKKGPVVWAKMVVRLMIALQSYRLPYTVNKRGTNKGPSPAVKLLHELQDRFPEEYRRHIGRDNEAADETMAAAASAAWRAYKNSRLGKNAFREQAKAEKARNEGREYKTLTREVRLNKVFKYLAIRSHRRLGLPPEVEAPPKSAS
ncbi:hypothetical protein QM467_01560 [Rhodoblastus sp. 17X3]|uniref:hypothetical protein n=1 Tax=Rhodoblastus sp. 17X3 TaxID=3047026 RepID=UPI0024B75B37|nr:hypothetical protein [Rhodoblastus sp. 17X3]MDI9846741.1 hypothetical protein [Rhodoblastus sp. 17X3]